MVGEGLLVRSRFFSLRPLPAAPSVRTARCPSGIADVGPSSYYSLKLPFLCWTRLPCLPLSPMRRTPLTREATPRAFILTTIGSAASLAGLRARRKEWPLNCGEGVDGAGRDLACNARTSETTGTTKRLRNGGLR